jgi:hypothetical protein
VNVKVKELIQQIEYTMGRQPEQYMIQLINDALMDMSGKVQHYTTEKIQNLNSKQRWYKLDDSVIDITRGVKNGKYSNSLNNDSYNI